MECFFAAAMGNPASFPDMDPPSDSQADYLYIEELPEVPGVQMAKVNPDLKTCQRTRKIHWGFRVSSLQGTDIMYAPRRKTPKKGNASKGAGSSSQATSGNPGDSSASPSGPSGAGSSSGAGAGAGAPGGEPPGGGGGKKTPNSKVKLHVKETPRIPLKFRDNNCFQSPSPAKKKRKTRGNTVETEEEPDADATAADAAAIAAALPGPSGQVRNFHGILLNSAT